MPLAVTPEMKSALANINRLMVTDFESNSVVSPAGVWLALSVLAAGAGGTTASELEELLGAGEEDLGALRNDLTAALESNTELKHLTAIWSKVALNKEFVESFPDVEFGDTVDAKAIDAWVKQATDGLIEKFPCEINEATALALGDVLKATGRWLNSIGADHA